MIVTKTLSLNYFTKDIPESTTDAGEELDVWDDKDCHQAWVGLNGRPEYRMTR